MRQSNLRQSHLPGALPNTVAAAKLLEKKKELEAVVALEEASAQFLKRIESLGDDFDVLADAGIVHGQVLEQWPNMFKILNLFLSSREQTLPSEGQASLVSTGERLVRVPVEDLQTTERA